MGQYPDGTPAEALAYFQRKFADLAGEVTLLETRHRRGGASASDLRSTAKTLRSKLDGAAAVGDLAALIARVDALTGELAEASETEAVAAKQASEEAVRERTAIVEEAEALAARDPQSVQWKQMTADMAALFDRWQAHQQNGPRLSKSTAQQLWRRFRDARATVDRHRREFFSSLDETHKAAREAKTRLVERAEALAPRGEDGIGAYRDLLDAWKASGRAGRKVDDALWARFKAAGDALYGARIERESADAEASKEKIEQKRALLEQAAPIVDEKNLATARQKLTAIQRQWDEIGRIFPRDKERALDDELRKIEQSVRTREDADWKRNDPEQKARANDMTRQLTDAIDKLEAELAEAEARGDKRAAAQASEALEAVAPGCAHSAADRSPQIRRSAVTGDTAPPHWRDGVALPVLRRRAPLPPRADRGVPRRRPRAARRGVHARRCRRDALDARAQPPAPARGAVGGGAAVGGVGARRDPRRAGRPSPPASS